MTKLQDKNTLSCGTVNSNRVGLPKDMKKTCPIVKKLKRGESLKRMEGRMLAVTWMDTRAENLLCNLSGCLGDYDMQRRDKRGGAEIVCNRVVELVHGRLWICPFNVCRRIGVI